MYVRNELKASIINLIVPKKPGIEDVWVSVQSHMFHTIIIGCVSRHPNTPLWVIFFIVLLFEGYYI